MAVTMKSTFSEFWRRIVKKKPDVSEERIISTFSNYMSPWNVKLFPNYKALQLRRQYF
jgi:hypothetical protein